MVWCPSLCLSVHASVCPIFCSCMQWVCCCVTRRQTISINCCTVHLRQAQPPFELYLLQQHGSQQLLRAVACFQQHRKFHTDLLLLVRYVVVVIIVAAAVVLVVKRSWLVMCGHYVLFDCVYLAQYLWKYLYKYGTQDTGQNCCFSVSSSEKVDKENRYSEFLLSSIPYPGCEFFRDWKDNGYRAEGLVFDWNQVLQLLQYNYIYMLTICFPQESAKKIGFKLCAGFVCLCLDMHFIVPYLYPSFVFETLPKSSWQRPIPYRLVSDQYHDYKFISKLSGGIVSEK